MRVLILAPHFAEYALRYANGLTNFATVSLLVSERNFHNETNGLSVEADPRLELQKLPLHTRRDRYLNLIAVIRRVADFRPDILHIQEVAHPLCFVTARFFRGRSKIFLTVHDPQPHSGSDSNIRPVDRWSRDIVRKNADIVVVHGQYCQDAFLLATHNSKLDTITTHHGKILSPAPDQIREPVPGRILFFGRMQEYKGLETLATAAELLHSRGVQFSLHVAGTGLLGIHVARSCIDRKATMQPGGMNVSRTGGELGILSYTVVGHVART